MFPWLLCASVALAGGDIAVSSQSARFLGFSANERVAVWQVDLQQPQPGGWVDHYSLIRVADTASGARVASFRKGRIVRKNAAGHRSKSAQAQLEQDNPVYQQAAPQSQWQALKRKSRLGYHSMPMDDSTVRLSPATGCQLTASAQADAITLSGARGSAIGFDTVGRRLDGELVNLGQFTQASLSAGATTGRVEVYFSKGGYAVATVVHFAGDGASKAQVRVVHLGERPIGSNKIGTYRYMLENMREGERHFKQLHPEGSSMYDERVGTLWEK